MPIKGKQILDDSLELKKLSSGIKILDSSSKLGVNKLASQFTDPNEFVTKQYVDDLSDDIDNETIIIDGNTLKVNVKSPVNSDEIGIVIDGTNGIHLNKSDISATILSGDGLTSSVNGDGEKTLSVNYGTNANEVNADLIPTVGYTWNTSALTGASIQDVLIAFDSDISTLNAATSGEVYNFQSGITETTNIVRLGGDLTQDTIISGDSGAYSLTINDMSAITLSTQAGSSIVVGSGNTTYTQGGSSSAGIQYAADYSATYTTRSLVDKQYVDTEITNNKLTIAAGSTDYLSINSDELSIKTLAVTDVITDNNSGTNFGDWYTNNYTTLNSTEGPIEEGDVLILTNINSSTEVWMNNGGTSGTTLDFTQIQTAAVSDSYIRSLISANNGVTYTPASGLIELGGSLTKNTTISGDSNSFELSGVSTTTISGVSTNISGITSLNINDGSSSGLSIDLDSLDIVTSGKELILNNGEHVLSLNPTTNEAVFTDSVGIGLQYAADYSANYTNRTLVDKEYVDSEITNNVSTVSVTNGLTEFSAGTYGIGGDLTQNTTISGNTGSYGLTINEISTLTLSTQSGYSLVMNGTAIFTDTTNSKGLEYAADYSANFTDESLITKRYVDAEIAIATTSGHTVWETLEATGSGVSGTSGQVSYLGAITFGDAIDEANVYVNGIRVQVPTEAYFDTPGNDTPAPGSTLYFDLDQLGYDIESDDEIIITYLITQ